MVATARSTTGPHASLLAQLLERAETMDEVTVLRLFHAWCGRISATPDPFMEQRCLRRAREEARRADRLDLFDGARSEAATRFRNAHRGEAGDAVGGLLGLSMAVADAAAALTVADRLDTKTFDWLYAPWRIAVEEAESLAPVGPGRLPFGAIAERRRMPAH